MSTLSHRRLTATAIVAAGTLLLAGAPPAAAQTPSQSPSSSAAGGSGQSVTTPGGAAPGQPSQPRMKGQAGKPAQRGSQTQLQLGRHARAQVMIEQKAPDVYAKLQQAKDINTDLSEEERQKLALALQGTGYTLAQYAREHKQIMASPQLQSRLQQVEQRVKAQAGGPGRSGAAGAPKAGGPKAGASTSASPSTGGAPSGGAQSTQPSGTASPAK